MKWNQNQTLVQYKFISDRVAYSASHSITYEGRVGRCTCNSNMESYPTKSYKPNFVTAEVAVYWVLYWVHLWSNLPDLWWILYMWCDPGKSVTCRKMWNCKIKEINNLILMFFLYFYNLWTSVTFDNSIGGDPSKKFRKEDNSNLLERGYSNFHVISITQNINFAPCGIFFSDHITYV